MIRLLVHPEQMYSSRLYFKDVPNTIQIGVFINKDMHEDMSGNKVLKIPGTTSWYVPDRSKYLYYSLAAALYDGLKSKPVNYLFSTLVDCSNHGKLLIRGGEQPSELRRKLAHANRMRTKEAWTGLVTQEWLDQYQYLFAYIEDKVAHIGLGHTYPLVSVKVERDVKSKHDRN